VDKDRDRDKEKEKNKSLDSISPPPISEARAQEMDELLRRLQPELSRAKPDPVALSAALEAVRHLAAEDDTERSADDVASALAREESGEPCGVCGQPNRPGNKFCGRCGVGISGSDQAEPQFQPGLLRDDAIALTDPFANSHADEAMNLGFLISFAGNVTFPKAQPIRDVAAAIPLDRMLIETDAPFLAPIPNRGKRNEPAWVREVAVKIAEVRGIEPAEVAARTTENFRAFFRTEIPV